MRVNAREKACRMPPDLIPAIGAEAFIALRQNDLRAAPAQDIQAILNADELAEAERETGLALFERLDALRDNDVRLDGDLRAQLLDDIANLGARQRDRRDVDAIGVEALIEQRRAEIEGLSAAELQELLIEERENLNLPGDADVELLRALLLDLLDELEALDFDAGVGEEVESLFAGSSADAELEGEAAVLNLLEALLEAEEGEEGEEKSLLEAVLAPADAVQVQTIVEARPDLSVAAFAYQPKQPEMDDAPWHFRRQRHKGEA